MQDDQDMTKYGVVLDDKTKQAEAGNAPRTCPVCHEKPDDGGSCPQHGTEGNEKKP